MPEHEIPLEELHEHMQHSAHESKEKWISAVALSTAFLAAFAAAAALLSSHYESESMKEHGEEYDKWSYYQSKGTEKLLLESQVKLYKTLGKTPDADDEKNIAKYEEKRKEAKAEAEHLKLMSRMHGESQERFALGVTMFQMSIAIGAISVLTRRRGFWYVSLCLGAVGIFFLARGYTTLPPSDEHGEKPTEHVEKAAEKSH